MKISDEDRTKIQEVIHKKIDLYSSEKQIRAYACANRLSYYAGDVKPNVGVGHESISTYFCSAIADKMSAYIGTNCFDINITADDITDEEQNTYAQTAEDIEKKILEDAPQWFLSANEIGSVMGDGLVATDIRNGIPRHYSIMRPENVTFIWRSDNFDELDGWAYDFGLTPEQVKDMWGKDMEPTYAPVFQNNAVSDRSGKSVYGLVPEQAQTVDTSIPKFVKITDFHTFVDLRVDDRVVIKADSNVILANDEIVEIRENKAKKLYHFKANVYPNLPTGTCDFEQVAETVTMYEKKLSEEADAVSQSVYHKFVTTNQNTELLKQKLKPNASQIIKLQDENDKLEVLNLQSNSYNSEPLVKNILNIIRTVSGLQELGQDQISPNISGKALAYVFQGVIQTVTKKRIRWEKIIKDMVVDDLFSLSTGEMRKAFFNDDGTFKFKINVIWPDVLSSDKSSKIADIVNLRSGAEPIVSAYTARGMIDIADPTMEQKRVDLEMAKKLEFQQALQGSLMQPSENTPTLNEGQNQGEQIASAQGSPGTAQTSGMSGAAAQNMVNQQGGQ
jgi:hypothetical protein